MLAELLSCCGVRGMPMISQCAPELSSHIQSPGVGVGGGWPSGQKLEGGVPHADVCQDLPGDKH